MPVVRDFQEPLRPRAPTSGTIASTASPPDRRGSIKSGRSVRSRHASRSNTVTTYHDQPDPENPTWQPGAEPGLNTAVDDNELLPPEITSVKAACDINIIDFSEEDEPQHVLVDNEGLAQELELPRPEHLPCRWISVNGLSWDVVKILGKKYHLHDLATEDLFHLRTRTKVDWYADQTFVVLTLQKLVKLHPHWNSDCPEDHPDLNSEKSEKVGARTKWWQRRRKQKTKSDLPYYLDKDGNGRVDEFVNAHSGISEEAPMKPTRTLHRYESLQLPQHTAFMEKHSALAISDYAVSVEQVAIFLLADNTVISFFEQSAQDVEIPILKRLHLAETMLRRSCDASMLLQSIIDTIVDLAGPIKDAYNEARKELQVEAMTKPDIRTSRALHVFGEELDMLQNLIKPIVKLINALRDHNIEPVGPAPLPMQPPNELLEPPQQETPKTETSRDRARVLMFNRQFSEYRKRMLPRPNAASSVSLTPLAHTYFGDVLDHCIILIQALEHMDASAGNISTLIFNTIGAKTNNFMMILAVVTVFFAPLTFISGYFGMNFSNGNGLNHPFAFFWQVAIPSVIGFMLLVFATKLWEDAGALFSRRGIKAYNERKRIEREKRRMRSRQYLRETR